MFGFMDHDVRKMVGRFCGFANRRRPRWLDSLEVFDLIDDGDKAILADIPANELHSGLETYLALSAISKTDGSRQYVLVERADEITGCVTHAAAVGKLPPPAILDIARELNVHCLEPTAKVTRPT